MTRHQILIWSTIVGLLGIIPLPALAQNLEREGTLQLDMVNDMIEESDTILSNGRLRGLDSDPNFKGDLEFLTESATSLLDNRTTVTRGGHFPENAGIPLNQQLTLDECVYRIFQLDNGNELIIYQSPPDENAQYLIRGSN